MEKTIILENNVPNPIKTNMLLQLFFKQEKVMKVLITRNPLLTDKQLKNPSISDIILIESIDKVKFGELGSYVVHASSIDENKISTLLDKLLEKKCQTWIYIDSLEISNSVWEKFTNNGLVNKLIVSERYEGHLSEAFLNECDQYYLSSIIPKVQMLVHSLANYRDWMSKEIQEYYSIARITTSIIPNAYLELSKNSFYPAKLAGTNKCLTVQEFVTSQEKNKSNSSNPVTLKLENIQKELSDLTLNVSRVFKKDHKNLIGEEIKFSILKLEELIKEKIIKGESTGNDTTYVSLSKEINDIKESLNSIAVALDFKERGYDADFNFTDVNSQNRRSNSPVLPDNYHVTTNETLFRDK